MTRLLAYAGEAALSLWRNRTRSVLTTLGMIIGTASIIAVFGISRGASSGISATITSLGSSPVFIQVDPTQNFPQYAQIQYHDATAVQEALGTRAKYVMPFYFRNRLARSGNVKHVEALAAGGFDDSTFAMQEGRRIDDRDVASAARVCTITADVARAFFGKNSALGKTLTIGGGRYEIVGVYPDLNGSLFNAIAGSSTISIPYSTFHRVERGPADQLIVYAADPNDADAVGELARKILQHIHGPTAEYQVQNGAALIQGFEKVLNVVAVSLSAIGGVALCVAGIGIMNIMLVSVTERTREIGIRKSIGASRTDIALQFLLEALLLAIAGGGTGTLLGLLISIGGAEAISRVIGAVVIPYVLIVSLAVAFSGAVGMLFGLYPAWRAANMDPIEALRS